MPLQNRVDPFGAVHAVPHRGLFMGNRGGCFHRDDQTLKDRRWTSRRWIICLLSFKDRKRPLMQPGLYTELFFLDEATAIAGGHRPCFECRRADAADFRDRLVGAGRLEPGGRIDDLDAQAAGWVQDVLNGTRARGEIAPPDLPDGAMFAVGRTAFLKQAGAARRWSFSGYGPPEPLPGAGTPLTPPISCEALRAGYAPALHPSATS